MRITRTNDYCLWVHGQLSERPFAQICRAAKNLLIGRILTREAPRSVCDVIGRRRNEPFTVTNRSFVDCWNIRRAGTGSKQECQIDNDEMRMHLWHLTPELSRPVAGRRTRASVAQKHVADATIWGRLERIVRWRWMPMQFAPWRTCRKTKREGPNAHP